MPALQGKILGAVPYDFRPPTFGKLRSTWWDPQSDTIIRPQAFGVGWTLNLAALKKRSPAAFWALMAFMAWRVARRIRRLAG